MEGKSGKDGGHAGHVAVFLACAVGVAEDYLTNGVGVDAGAFHCFPDHQGGEVVRPDRGKCPTIASDRRPCATNKKSLDHENILREVKGAGTE